MKCLDTPVLLELLHDAPGTQELLRGLRGEEIATTELNLFELQVLSAAGSRAQRAARDTGIARLRRRVTVLPIPPEATREAARFLRDRRGATDYRPLMWGAAAAAGCGEWITTKTHAPPKQTAPFKVRIL